MAEKYLGNILVLRTRDGQFAGAGRCIAYCDAPSVTAEDVRGERYHWRADLVQVLTDDQAVAQALVPQAAGAVPEGGVEKNA